MLTLNATSGSRIKLLSFPCAVLFINSGISPLRTHKHKSGDDVGMY